MFPHQRRAHQNVEFGRVARLLNRREGLPRGAAQPDPFGDLRSPDSDGRVHLARRESAGYPGRNQFGGGVARFVQYAHASELQVKVWTVDDAADMRRLLSWGVDAIISDRPDVAVEVVKARTL